MAKKIINSEPVEMPATIMVDVVATESSAYLKAGKAYTMHRNVAEKLIKKGFVTLKQ